MFDKWFCAARWCYNKAKEVQDLRYNHGAKPLSKYDIRSFVVSQIPEWFADVPFLIKAGAVLDYVDACKNACIKFKQTGEVSEIGYRSKKTPTQSCVIKPESVTKTGIYPTISGELKTSEPLHTDGESILKRENGKYYMIVTIKNTEKVTCREPSEDSGDRPRSTLP